MHDDPGSTQAHAARAAAGDVSGWENLDERLRPWLRSILLTRQLPFGYCADDVINITFAYVYRDIHRFRVGPGTSFRRWVATIMIHRLATLAKMGKARKRAAGRIVPLDAALGSTGGTPQIEDVAAESVAMRARCDELARHFGAAIADLDPETRRILELRVLGGLEFGAIAAHLGRGKPDTLRVTFKRAMEVVRQRMRAHAP